MLRRWLMPCRSGSAAGAGVKKIEYSLPQACCQASGVDVHGHEKGGELDVERVGVGVGPSH